MYLHGKCACLPLRRAASFGNSLSLQMDKKSLSVEILGSRSETCARGSLKPNFNIIMGILTSLSVQPVGGSRRAEPGSFSFSISKIQKRFRNSLERVNPIFTTVYCLDSVKTTNISQPLLTHTTITLGSTGSCCGNAMQIPSSSNTHGRCRNSGVATLQDPPSPPPRTVRLCWQSPENMIPKFGNFYQSVLNSSQRLT